MTNDQKPVAPKGKGLDAVGATDSTVIEPAREEIIKQLHAKSATRAECFDAGTAWADAELRAQVDELERGLIKRELERDELRKEVEKLKKYIGDCEHTDHGSYKKQKRITQLEQEVEHYRFQSQEYSLKLLETEQEVESLSVKLQRTESAAYHALLEMSAWMGIPENKRHTQIEELMSNVKYCAKHDLRHVDESQRNVELRNIAESHSVMLADSLKALDLAGEILTLTHPELSNVEMNTLTARQYAIWSRSALSDVSERIRAALAQAEGEK